MEKGELFWERISDSNVFKPQLQFVYVMVHWDHSYRFHVESTVMRQSPTIIWSNKFQAEWSKYLPTNCSSKELLMWYSLLLPADNTSLKHVQLFASFNVWNKILLTLVIWNSFSRVPVHTCFSPCKFSREIKMSVCERPPPHIHNHTRTLSSALGSMVWYSISTTFLWPQQAFPVCQTLFHGNWRNKGLQNKAPRKHNVLSTNLPQWMQPNAFRCDENPIESWYLLHFQYNIWNWSLRLNFSQWFQTRFYRIFVYDVVSSAAQALNLGPIFVVLAISPISYDNIELTRVIADVWEHGNIATTKSNRERNTSSQTISWLFCQII